MIAQRAPGAFTCRLWPECGCPVGTVDRDCPGLDAITIPPGDDTFLVCAEWPECGCAGNCDSAASVTILSRQQGILFAVLSIIALAGVGLIWLAVR